MEEPALTLDGFAGLARREGEMTCRPSSSTHIALVSGMLRQLSPSAVPSGHSPPRRFLEEYGFLPLSIRLIMVAVEGFERGTHGWPRCRVDWVPEPNLAHSRQYT